VRLKGAVGPCGVQGVGRCDFGVFREAVVCAYSFGREACGEV